MEALVRRMFESLGRVDHLVTYALVTFVRTLLARFFSLEDTLYLAGTVVVLTAGVLARGTGYGVLERTAASAHGVGGVLLADAIMSAVPRPATADTGAASVLFHWTLSTASVILVPTLLTPVLRDDTAAKVSQLVLFMYAENSGFITRDAQVNHVLPVLALFVLCAARAREASPAPPVLAVVLRALAMLATNVVISTMLDDGATSTHDATEIAWLVAVLILFENVQRRFEVAGELKDYAVWKASTLVAARLALAGVPPDAVLFGALLFTAAAHALQAAVAAGGGLMRYDAVVQLGALVGVNAALAAVQAAMAATPPAVVWILLLSVLNAVHIALA